ncbi:MAG: hypothetical protein ABFS03_04360 [Chloroflexota bacterium]
MPITIRQHSNLFFYGQEEKGSIILSPVYAWRNEEKPLQDMVAGFSADTIFRNF